MSNQKNQMNKKMSIFEVEDSSAHENQLDLAEDRPRPKTVPAASVIEQ